MSIKICIDAGHYGKYNRSPVVPEYYESQAMWKLHLLLKKCLEQYGIEVITTRASQEKDLDLFKRGAASKGCDLFLSLHSNAASSESVNYVVCMHQVDDNCGVIDEESKAVAELLANCVASVMGAEAKTWSTKSSSDRDGNGYKDDYYGVLRGAHSVGTAGVIIEHSFHTNTRAAKWLLDESNLDELAKAEADAIAAHYGINKPVTAENKEGVCTVEIKVLKKGAKGDTVKAMQTLLIGYGFDCGEKGADSSFGPATDKALRAYQGAKGLEVDGSCGPASWASLLGVG